jgi:addiction module HigA family antidote
MKRDIEPIHPGEHLAEFIEELEISQYRLAKELHVPQLRISQIVRGQRSITADTALRLAKFFGTTPLFWLNLQTRYDLETTEGQLAPMLDKVQQYRPDIDSTAT